MRFAAFLCLEVAQTVIGDTHLLLEYRDTSSVIIVLPYLTCQLLEPCFRDRLRNLQAMLEPTAL